MKRREMGRTRWAALAAVVVLLAGWPAAGQESGDEVGEVVQKAGRATGQPGDGAIGVLGVGDDVLLDMWVRTGPESSVTFTFIPRGTMTLASNAEVQIDRMDLDASGVYDSKIKVAFGYVRTALSNLVSGNHETETPAASIGVKGTVFGVRVVEDGETTVWAFEAVGDDLTVTSRATGDSVVLQTGQVTVVAPGQAPTPPIPFDPKSGVGGGITLPPPPLPPDVFDEPPLPPGDNDLPPDRGNEDGPPVVFDDPVSDWVKPSTGGNEPNDDGRR